MSHFKQKTVACLLALSSFILPVFAEAPSNLVGLNFTFADGQTFKGFTEVGGQITLESEGIKVRYMPVAVQQGLVKVEVARMLGQEVQSLGQLVLTKDTPATLKVDALSIQVDLIVMEPK